MRYSIQVLSKRSELVLICMSCPKVWNYHPCFTDGKLRRRAALCIAPVSLPAPSLSILRAYLEVLAENTADRLVLFHKADVRRGAEMEDEATTQPVRSLESISAINGVTDVTTNHSHFFVV